MQHGFGRKTVLEVLNLVLFESIVTFSLRDNAGVYIRARGVNMSRCAGRTELNPRSVYLTSTGAHPSYCYTPARAFSYFHARGARGHLAA
jgi:hypothetical protein